MSTWYADAPPPRHRKLGPMDWVRVVWRGTAMALVIGGLFVVLMLARLVEGALVGLKRPVTPYIVQLACRISLFIIQLPVVTMGPRIKGPGAVVANHSSWLDIFALHARKNVFFVSKAEVRGWPGIGPLAAGTGTVFIQRDPRQAKAQTELFEQRLLAGQRLLFFPEGTSTDGRRVLPFKTSLFGAFFSDALRNDLSVQAVSVVYHAPQGEDPRVYGWWGDMSFGEHLVQILALPRQGRVTLVYHTPAQVADFRDRKALARHLETQVRQAHNLTSGNRDAADPSLS